MNLVEISASFISRILSLHLLHDLLAKAADLGGALDGHVLGALVAGKYISVKKLNISISAQTYVELTP